MAIYRVHKIKNFTSVNNYLIKDENLSLKDKGMMVVLLSLPEQWEYSVMGLKGICKESKDTINGILNNLEKYEYLERHKVRNNKGQFVEWKYDIYEIPKPLYEKENPYPKNRDMEKPDMENYTQLNTNKLNTKELKKEIYKERFKKPTLKEIEEYCRERNKGVDAKKFFDYYEVSNWTDSNGNKVKNWKQKVITWEKHQKEAEDDVPYWMKEGWKPEGHFIDDNEIGSVLDGIISTSTQFTYKRFN